MRASFEVRLEPQEDTRALLVTVSLRDGWSRSRVVPLTSTQGLFAVVTALLAPKKGTPASLARIVVVRGKGSFSAVRQAVSFANTLNWLFQTPLSVIDGDGKPRKVAGTMKPKYSHEPNISTPKKQTGT